jgi:methylmalonyl-CoA mutase
MSQTPDFTTMAYGLDFPKPSFAEWKARVEQTTGKTLEHWVSTTMEQIEVNPLYARDDIKDLKHLGYVAGVPPFLRGPYPAMYVTQPWTVRQYASFSTAEESNAFLALQVY